MEALTRLVTESLVRHGFDRPVDYRRLHWSRWFRCESHHSLLFVPSKPGVFAVAEEIIDLGQKDDYLAMDASPARRMLAVTQFFEDDDMAFVLDRMLTGQNPMRARLNTGHYFVRFVVIEDQTQRRSICGALNQWIVSTAEKATGIGSHFASSLELTPATEYIPPANETQSALFKTAKDDAKDGKDRLGLVLSMSALGATDRGDSIIPAIRQATAPQLDSGAATNIHCPSPLPAGF